MPRLRRQLSRNGGLDFAEPTTDCHKPVVGGHLGEASLYEDYLMKFATAALLAVNAVLLASAAAASVAPPIAVRFIGLQTLAADATYEGTRVGGLSGIDYDKTTGLYTAIADDRSQLNPARFYNFDLAYTSTSFTAATPVKTTVIKRPDGSAFPAASVDPESIRKTSTGTYVWSSEGDASTPAAFQNPTIR